MVNVSDDIDHVAHAIDHDVAFAPTLIGTQRQYDDHRDGGERVTADPLRISLTLRISRP